MDRREDLPSSLWAFLTRRAGTGAYCAVGAAAAGFVDWDAIVDRGRTPVKPQDWSDPAELLEAAARGFRVNRWLGQGHHVEVWCEKDALSSVIEPVCARYHVHFLANRGYSSSTAMYDSSKRFQEALDQGQQPVVIYLGDHDPSGLDMSRDVWDRLDLMTYQAGVEVVRLALSIDQVDFFQPPPNPTKLKDSRAPGYVQEYGADSWELDALEPQVLDGMVRDAIENYLDLDLYEEMIEREEAGRAALLESASRLRQGESW